MTRECLAEFRNLLVAFNGSEASVAALRTGLEMARCSDAHVTGLLAHGSSVVSSSIPAWFSDTLRRSIIDTVSERATDIRQRFLAETNDTIAPARLHWLEIGGDPDRTISDYSRMFDLTLVGRFDAVQTAEELALHPGRISEDSGRPVMVVPAQGTATAVPSHVLIAWDGMRAATGAVAAAMPFLRAAIWITAVTIETGRTGTQLDGIDLPEMLRRHGLQCDWIRLPPGKGGAARTVLEQGRLLNADLIVLGLPSHGEVGRMITGSVTQDILENAEIPLFLSR